MAALSSRLALVLAFSPAPALAGVRIVDATGRGDHTSIAAAVAAASEGDLLLVRSGSYAGFDVRDKGLVILRDVGALVTIDGTISIEGLSASKTFVLGGFVVNGPVSSLGSGPALTLLQDTGHMRIEDCELHGGRGYGGSGNPWNPGAVGVDMQNCFDAAFVRCTISGGDGEGTAPGMGFFDFGGGGGDALRARFSAVAAYDCTLRAGAGGGGEGEGGDGGTAYDHDQGGGGAFLSRCSLQAGNGGYAHGYGIGGHGGNGMYASSAAHHHVLDSTVVPGQGGASTGYAPGPDGLAFAGPGSHELLAGSGRTLSAGFLAASGGQLAVDVHGQPGDRVYLLHSVRTSFVYSAALKGVQLEPESWTSNPAPLVVLPASGTASFVFPLGSLPAGYDKGTLFLQGFVRDASGACVLGSPVFAQVLRCATLLPDCDGNGQFDTCDLLSGSAADLGHDGIPDSCDPDCNGNGLPDDLDILNGTSADANGDGVPDSCEGPRTLHVDASAPPFGDGSAAAPFRTIHEGIGASASGDTVLVEDGAYTGVLNRDLSLGGRSIVIESAHGPAGCVIDCQLLGRAFAVHEGESAATAIRGFTIRNGQPGLDSWDSFYGGGGIAVVGAAARIEGCQIESCSATQGGGGVFGQSADVTILDCTFHDNGVATSYSPGGGLRLHGVNAVVRACVFEQNTGSSGGGLMVTGSSSLIAEGCSFRGNSAVVYGGGAVIASAGLLDNCLFSGNSAPHGGGVAGHGGLTLVHCTIQGNSATQDAGGLYCAYDSAGGTLAVHDTILWGNSAPAAAQIGSVNFGDALQLRSSDLQGGAGGIAIGGGTLDYDASNIVLDPLFVSASDLHLGPLSPCIDAANNNLVPADVLDLDGDGNTGEAEPYDLDGAPRFVDIPGVVDTGIGSPPLTDIGAYERQP
jgi:predicted outer membrane repeat protein